MSLVDSEEVRFKCPHCDEELVIEVDHYYEGGAVLRQLRHGGEVLQELSHEGEKAVG